jgi:Peptidase_C39 like family
MHTPEEIRYYRTKATGLIGRKYTDYAWVGDEAFEPQDYSLDAKVRVERGIVPRPAASLPYVGIISPLVTTKEILLDVRFNPQTDNVWRSDRLRPDNTCSCSSTDAFVNFFIPGATASDDDYIKAFDAGNYGDTTDHAAHVACCEWDFGLLTEFRTDFTFADLDAELEAGRPVVLAFLHRGTVDNPTGGHVAVCRGKTADSSKYWFMDPYGSMNDGYMGSVENGRCVLYTKAALKTRWYAPPGYEKGGYVRIFKGLAAKKA